MNEGTLCFPALGSSFIRQGRLNREYLRFLWVHRKLEEREDGEGDFAGVQLDDKSFDSMLDTMIRYLFIYRAHGTSDSGQEVFIVPARLPEYGNEKVLEESIGLGEAVVGTTAWFLRSHLPSGIIGRFLAFTAAKVVSSGACWQHGAHVRWEKDSNVHDVLLCETTVEKHCTCPAIAICVKGKTAEARGVLWEVQTELERLIENNVHGYPGICLPAFDEVPIRPSNELQKHLLPYLDIQFASLHTILKKISRDSLRMFQASFPSCTDENELPYPRLVMLKPIDSAEGQPASDGTDGEGAIQMRETWDRWVQLWKRGRGRDFTLVFLCEHDFSEIRCGPVGTGFPVHDPGELIKSIRPLLQVCCALVVVVWPYLISYLGGKVTPGILASGGAQTIVAKALLL